MELVVISFLSRFLCIIAMIGGFLTTEVANCTTVQQEEILSKIGSTYISRVRDTIISNGINDSNLGFVHEITTFSNLLFPTPSNLQIIFNEKTYSQELIIEELKAILRTKNFVEILSKSLVNIENAQRYKNEELFKKSTELFFGTILLWYSRSEYSLFEFNQNISEETLFNQIEYVGRAEQSILIKDNVYTPDSVFCAAYLLRFHQRHDVSDLFYFWAAIEPRLKATYGDNLDNLPPFLTRKLFDFLVFAVEQGQNRINGLAQNFLIDFELIFSSIEKHFPFHQNIGNKNYGKLGLLRDHYKSIGNTSMVDRINRLRLESLSRYPELTPSVIERVLLKTWGVATNWGTSVHRIVILGFILIFALLLSSLNASYEKVYRPSQDRVESRLEKSINYYVEATDLFVSYATIKGNKQFESKPLDHFFSLSFFVYYSILLGAILTFIVRHN